MEAVNGIFKSLYLRVHENNVTETSSGAVINLRNCSKGTVCKSGTSGFFSEATVVDVDIFNVGGLSIFMAHREAKLL